MVDEGLDCVGVYEGVLLEGTGDGVQLCTRPGEGVLTFVLIGTSGQREARVRPLTRTLPRGRFAVWLSGLAVPRFSSRPRETGLS